MVGAIAALLLAMAVSALITYVFASCSKKHVSSTIRSMGAQTEDKIYLDELTIVAIRNRLRYHNRITTGTKVDLMQRLLKLEPWWGAPRIE